MATKNQEKVLDIVVKDVKKGRKLSIRRAMKESGVYSPSFADTQSHKLTQSKGWKELIEQHLPDSFIAKRHRKLFDQKKVEYFSFGKNKTDEEIEEAVTGAGLELINISHTADGKLAFYSVDDVHAVTKALEMAHKIKGVYLADKTLVPAQTVHYNLFHNPVFQQTIQSAESEMKRVIENAQTPTTNSTTE